MYHDVMTVLFYAVNDGQQGVQGQQVGGEEPGHGECVLQEIHRG